MRFLPNDNIIDIYNQDFEDDLLGRLKTSKAISDILERIEDPLVIALDGRWGTGKSYFLKRWVGAHKMSNGGTATTVYFDAFANDYLNDPLIALVSALTERMPLAKKPKLDRVKAVAIKFMRPIARIGLSIATAGASQVLNELGDAAVGAVGAEADMALNDFWRQEEGRRTAMEEFRASITALMTAEEDGQEIVIPLIIVIDELDRCRPDYALEVLEVIKHFFSVDRVHFILGVNLKALENSVKVRYGSEIDATSYLQKFISFKCSLPDHVGDDSNTPSVIKYIQHIGRNLEIPEHIIRMLITEIKVHNKNNNVSIRDIGKIMSNIALLPVDALNPNILFGWRMVTITLIVSRVCSPHIFNNFLKSNLKDSDLRSYYGASDIIVNRALPDGHQNPDFDHETYLLYTLWSFIIRDGNLDNQEEARQVAREFDQWGTVGNSKRIPQDVYNRWLNIFKAA